MQTNKDVHGWVKEVESRGAGEILLQTIDNDGRQRGFNLELSKEIVDSVNIPVIVSSGAGKLEDIKELIEYAKPSGIAIASLLHYNKFTIKDIKNYLRENNIKVSA
jgi:cyclase